MGIILSGLGYVWFFWLQTGPERPIEQEQVSFHISQFTQGTSLHTLNARRRHGGREYTIVHWASQTANGVGLVIDTATGKIYGVIPKMITIHEGSIPDANELERRITESEKRGDQLHEIGHLVKLVAGSAVQVNFPPGTSFTYSHGSIDAPDLITLHIPIKTETAFALYYPRKTKK